MYQAAEERYQKMDYVYCGKSGLKLPEVSLGFWHNFGDTGVYENMKQICFTGHLTRGHALILQNNYGPEPAVRRRIWQNLKRRDGTAQR